VAFGAVAGGIGSELTGGNFWQGALIGGVVAGLNHTLHMEDGPGPKQKTPGNKYGTLEEYRAWRDYPGYHEGETWFDRFCRMVNSNHIEIMRDEGSGGGMMYGGFGSAQKFTINPSKFDYFFGRVVTGSEHNIMRSAQNSKDLATLGIKTQSQLTKVFGKAIRSGTVITTKTNQYGTTVMRNINIGNKGSINVGFFYKGGNLNSTPSVSTIIPKIHK
jgi:hypothetical protein